MPEGVLVQSLRYDDEGEEAGWRVWSDGRHEGRPARGEWVDGPCLDDGALARLREVLADPALDAMAGVHRAAGAEHSSTLWVQIARPGEPLAVALVDGAHLDSLNRLMERLAPILTGAGTG